MKKQYALGVYMNKMFKIFILLVPLLALGAGINFSMFKLLGYYPNVSWVALGIFDVTNVIYCALGIFFAKKCEDKNKNLKPKWVLAGKIVISLVILIQWNYISYMIPSREFWAFFALFIFVSVFFLDSKYVLITIGIVVGSIIVSWIINGDNLLPIRDESFVPELVLRCILIVFVCFMFYLISVIVERVLVKELENIAEYDSLTFLRNRRTLSLKIDEAIENYAKDGSNFCFFIGDIDNFKKVNDTYGHPFGDIVLRDIGKQFIFTIYDKGDAFRYGGEEICGLLYMIIDDACKLTDELRMKISEEVHTRDDINVKVTMSFGLCEYKSGMKEEDLIKIADTNLYYAKNHGKNVVII